VVRSILFKYRADENVHGGRVGPSREGEPKKVKPKERCREISQYSESIRVGNESGRLLCAVT